MAMPSVTIPSVTIPSVTIPSTNNNKSDLKEKDLLFEKWWSSFNILNAPKLHWGLLLITISTIFHYPIEHLFFNNGNFDVMTNIVHLYRFSVSITIFCGCLCLKFGKLFDQIYQKLYRKSQILATNHTNQSNCWQSFKFFLSNIHYSWIYIFVLSIFFSFIVPLIHPDMSHQWFDYLIPGIE
jgi:hypothetical protein